MKYKLGAAVAVVSLMCAPAIVVASGSSWAVVTGATKGDHHGHHHDDDDDDDQNAAQIVTGLDHSWATIQLLHDAFTQHQLIDTSNYLPPDPCKRIADRWNNTVMTHPNSLHKFEHLFVRMANHSCKITFVGGTTNPGGSVNLAEVTPKP